MEDRYYNIDGLRVVSCLCIVMMHIQANVHYNIPLVLNNLMKSWTHLVLLFMIISGFGMFCGYYDKFRFGNLNLNAFYSKRYNKILPFFISLIIVDVIVNHNTNSVIEGITEATLVFGLLPNNQLEVIGVSWTLGVIFLFYMLFPFVVFLCWDKKRTVYTFIASLIISFFCVYYFFSDQFVISNFTPRHNFIYCSPLFIGGGLLYLYRLDIKKIYKKNKVIYYFICFLLSAILIALPETYNGIDFSLIRYLSLFMIWLSVFISCSCRLCDNNLVKYLSSISMEMYLSHMFVFRILEKTGCLNLFGQGLKGLAVTWLTVVIGMILLINVWKYCYKKVTNIFKSFL